MKIFLWGFMGAGKSSVGQKVALENNYDFIDLDSYIETQEQKTISKIFETIGEDEFRILETNYLFELCKKKKDFILACGGGTPCFNQNASLMNAIGITIYLKVQESQLTERLWNEKHKRPLIANTTSKNELHQLISNMISHREELYQQAKFTIENNDIENCVKDINRMIQKKGS